MKTTFILLLIVGDYITPLPGYHSLEACKVAGAQFSESVMGAATYSCIAGPSR